MLDIIMGLGLFISLSAIVAYLLVLFLVWIGWIRLNIRVRKS